MDFVLKLVDFTPKMVDFMVCYVRCMNAGVAVRLIGVSRGTALLADLRYLCRNRHV